MKTHEAALAQYRTEKTALKYYLVGRGFHRALKALGFIERLVDSWEQVNRKPKLRKDGVTPALSHQIRIALSVTQLKDLIDEERCIVAALLHDEQEDNHISTEELTAEFGEQTAEDVWCLTKKYRGMIKDMGVYLSDCAHNLAASIVKGVDRNNNLSTMIGVFTVEKMKAYAAEAKAEFLPMIKQASKLYPEQLQAYNAISQQMKLQLNFLEEFINTAINLQQDGVQTS